MDKLENLYTGVFVVFLLLVFYVFFHYYNLEKENADTNGDGIVDENELSYHIKKELEKRSKQPPRLRGIIKSCVSGLFRGFLMGMLLTGMKGAITSAIVLGTINPIVTGIEHNF